MTTKTNVWLRGAAAAVITGVASAGLSALGVAGASAIDKTVGNLNWTQVGVVCLMGGLVGLFAYLKQSPFPPAE